MSSPSFPPPRSTFLSRKMLWVGLALLFILVVAYLGSAWLFRAKTREISHVVQHLHAKEGAESYSVYVGCTVRSTYWFDYETHRLSDIGLTVSHQKIGTFRQTPFQQLYPSLNYSITWSSG